MVTLEWTRTRTEPSRSFPVGIAHGNGMFLAPVADGSLPVAQGVLASPDGVSWSEAELPPRTTGSWTIRNMIWAAGRFLSVDRGNEFLESADGVTWTARPTGLPSTRLPNNVAYGNGVYVVVSQSNYLDYSRNGYDWTNVLGFVSGSHRTQVVFTGGRFFTPGYTSVDGITWEVSNPPTLIAYGDGLFVGTNPNGDINTSTDGLTWQTVVSGHTPLRDLVYGHGLFVGCGFDGVVSYSTNGTEWHEVTTPDYTGRLDSAGVGSRGVFLVAGGAPPGSTGAIFRATHNRPPTAPTLLAPLGGVAIDRFVLQEFSWDPSDPDEWDTQSAYRFYARPTGTSAWAVDTGWVNTPYPRHRVEAGTFSVGPWEWQVATKDSQGHESPRSESGFFFAGLAPDDPTILSPVNGATIAGLPVEVEWSTPEQDAFQVQVRDGANVLWDSGTVVSRTTRSQRVPMDDNHAARVIAVRIQVAGLWSGWVTVSVTTSFTPPPTPSLAATVHPDTGGIGVIPTFPAPVGTEPAVAEYDVHVRRVGDTSPGIRVAAGVDPGQAWTSTNRLGGSVWEPRSGVDYELSVTAHGTNGTVAHSRWER